MESNWFTELFINEAKPAMQRHSGGDSAELAAQIAEQAATISQQASTIEDLNENLETANSTIATKTSELDVANTTISEQSTQITELETWKSENTFASEYWKDKIQMTNMSNMFYNCANLTSVPLFDTSKVTSMNNMFYNCTNLTSVPLFDTSKAVNMASMFYNCTNLTDCYLRNIKTNLQVGSGTSYGHLLTLDSLKHLIYELRDTGSLKTLTIGDVNLAKLADVYVKFVDITDEMRAEDEFIDEKLPYVVCESTDEGAMLITNYVAEKNWTLK